MPRRRTALLAVTALALAACGVDADEEAAAPDADPAPDLDAGDDPEVGDEPAPPEDPDPTEPTDPTDPTEGDDGVTNPVLEVVATVAPIADLVAQVGGDRVEVAPLVPAGADAHTYEPRPQDVVVLTDADAYVGVGLGLNDGALRLAEENLADDAVLIRLGEELLDDDELVFDHSHEDHGHAHGGDGDDHGHAHRGEGDDHGHSHGDEGDDQGHSHGDELGPNPHVWTSLTNAQLLVDGIATTLIELDPEGADVYEDNAGAYRDRLDELHQLVGDGTATIPSDARTLVTYHDAWTYFARDHDLEFARAVQPSDVSDPSASEVREVIDLIRELDVPVVFGSEVFPTPVLETIAEETGAEYRGDLADDVLPGDPGDPEHTYLELMRRNAVTIVDGLGGDPSQIARFDAS